MTTALRPPPSTTGAASHFSDSVTSLNTVPATIKERSYAPSYPEESTSISSVDDDDDFLEQLRNPQPISDPGVDSPIQNTPGKAKPVGEPPPKEQPVIQRARGKPVVSGEPDPIPVDAPKNVEPDTAPRDRLRAESPDVILGPDLVLEDFGSGSFDSLPNANSTAVGSAGDAKSAPKAAEKKNKAKLKQKEPAVKESDSESSSDSDTEEDARSVAQPQGHVNQAYDNTYDSDVPEIIIDKPEKPSETDQKMNGDLNQEDEPRSMNPLPDLPKGCFFEDGKRLIDLVIVFDKKKKDASRNKIYRKKFVGKLEALGLETELFMNQTGKRGFIKIHAPYDFLAMNAEMIGMRVPIADIEGDKPYSATSKLMNACKCCQIGGEDCFRLSKDKRRPVGDYYYMRFERAVAHHFLGNENPDTFFSTIQRIEIVNYVVQRLTLNRVEKRWPDEDADEVEEEEEESPIVDFQWLKNNGVFTCEMPLHDCDIDDMSTINLPVDRQPLRRYLIDSWGNFGSTFKYQPLDQIRQYFGAQIGLYFAWLGFYTKWLIILAIISILCLLFGIRNLLHGEKAKFFCGKQAENTTMCRACNSDTCPFTNLKSACAQAKFASMFDNETTLIFAVVVSVWAVLFIEFWKRYQNTVGIRWETNYGSELGDILRPQYALNVHTKRVSPITKQEEPYVKMSEKARRVMSSIMIVSVMIFMLLALLIGTIMYRSASAILIGKAKNHLPKLLPPSLLASITSAVANLIVIQLMSAIYPKVARKMTEYELPRTDIEFDASYTYKVVCFQYINFYGSLIYLAFLRSIFATVPSELTIFTSRCAPVGCLMDLTIQLIIIMTVKQILQNSLEMGTPKIQNYIAKFKREKQEKGIAPRWEQDYDLVPGKQPVAFGDYLEMMIQYGFLTMFAPAFPLAAFFALLNNVLEIRIDATKYLKDMRRVMPCPVNDIGPWQDILEITTKLSVVLNAFIIAFTSATIDEVYYDIMVRGSPNAGSYMDFAFSNFHLSLYPEDLRENEYNATFCVFPGMYRFDDATKEYSLTKHFYLLMLIRLAFVVIFEHVVFLLQSIVSAAIPDIPDDVETRVLREKHLSKQKFMQTEYGEDYNDEINAALDVMDNASQLGDSMRMPPKERLVPPAPLPPPQPVETPAPKVEPKNLAPPTTPEPAQGRAARAKLAAADRLKALSNKLKTPSSAAPAAGSSPNQNPGDGLSDIPLDTAKLTVPDGAPSGKSAVKQRKKVQNAQPDVLSASSTASTLVKNHTRRKQRRNQRQQQGNFMARMVRRLTTCNAY